MEPKRKAGPGIVLDAARLDHQLGLRGITHKRLCALSGVAEPTLSRALHGRGISPTTLRRLTETLLSIPLVVGADLLIAVPGTEPVPA